MQIPGVYSPASEGSILALNEQDLRSSGKSVAHHLDGFHIRTTGIEQTQSFTSPAVAQVDWGSIQPPLVRRRDKTDTKTSHQREP